MNATREMSFAKIFASFFALLTRFGDSSFAFYSAFHTEFIRTYTQRKSVRRCSFKTEDSISADIF